MMFYCLPVTSPTLLCLILTTSPWWSGGEGGPILLFLFYKWGSPDSEVESASKLIFPRWWGVALCRTQSPDLNPIPLGCSRMWKKLLSKIRFQAPDLTCRALHQGTWVGRHSPAFGQLQPGWSGGSQGTPVCEDRWETCMSTLILCPSFHLVFLWRMKKGVLCLFVLVLSLSKCHSIILNIWK